MSDHGVITEAATVRFERLLPGPIERVWEYLTQADKRATWFAGGEMELRRGGKVELRFRHADLSQPGEVPPEKYRKVHEEGLITYGEITRCEPPRLLSFLWGKDGEVTLTGTVDDRRTKRMAEQAVEGLAGVHDVVNQLRVKRASESAREGSTRAEASGGNGTTSGKHAS